MFKTLLSNEITEASGNWKMLPDGSVLMAIPLNENPELSDMHLVTRCLLEVQMAYPRIAHFNVSTVYTEDFGYVLQIIVVGK